MFLHLSSSRWTSLFSHLLLLFAVSSAFGSETTTDTFTERAHAYLDLLKTHSSTLGPLGNQNEGEIEIITDLNTMRQIEKETGRQLGIISHDKYWRWINDPVIFPSGQYGIYGRILWNRSLEGPPGVAVIPVDKKNGLVYLICNYRHATRSWELELPKGLREPGESFEEAAKREAHEETGLIVNNLQLLGMMAPDTGMTTSIVPVVLAEVVKQDKASPESTEAIAGSIALPIDKLRQVIQQGHAVVTISGQQRTIPVRDSFLTYALLQLELRHFFDQN